MIQEETGTQVPIYKMINDWEMGEVHHLNEVLNSKKITAHNLD